MFKNWGGRGTYNIIYFLMLKRLRDFKIYFSLCTSMLLYQEILQRRVTNSIISSKKIQFTEN